MRNKILVAALGAAVLLPLAPPSAPAQEGHASWYALRSRTASGEMMNPSALTAAHKSLPFGTRVRVENMANGRSIVVRINDRGPFVRGRIIDVSRGAASELGMIGAGTARVRITAIGRGGSGGSFGGSDTSFRDRPINARAGGATGRIVWVDGRPAFGG